MSVGGRYVSMFLMACGYAGQKIVIFMTLRPHHVYRVRDDPRMGVQRHPQTSC